MSADNPANGSVASDEGPEKATQQVLDDIHADATAEADATSDIEFGRAGRPFDRRAPFFIGFVGALGVASAFALAYIVVAAGQILLLIGLAFFLRSVLIRRSDRSAAAASHVEWRSCWSSPPRSPYSPCS